MTTSPEEKSPEALREDIRRTRAEMSQTVGALEQRLHPERLKREARARAEDVKDRVHPQRIAERAGEAMLDTIRDHPLTSIIAGLSIGYLVKKSGERASSRDDYGRRSRRRSARREERYEPAYYRERGYAESGFRREPDYGEEGPSMRERAREQAGGVGERISETAGQVQERAEEMGHRMQERAYETSHRMQHRMEHARGGLDEFVSENPLAAGAIALGLGALFGGAMPSTDTEDEWIGPMRDEAADRAEAAAREGMRRAKEAPEHLAQKTQEAAEEVSQTARSEAQEVKETAKSEAKDVVKEAAKQAKEK